MKIIYAATGREPILEEHTRDPFWSQIELIAGIITLYIASTLTMHIPKQIVRLIPIHPQIVALVLIGAPTAIVIYCIEKYARRVKYRKMQNLTNLITELRKTTIISPKKGVATFTERRKPKVAIGRYTRVHQDSGYDEYMIWLFKDVPAQCFIVAEKNAVLPVYDFGDYYAAVLPPGKDYYLKLEKHIEIGNSLDKAKLIQVDGKKEIELHYVAGKSKDAIVSFKCNVGEIEIIRARGLPFQQLVITAGNTDDITIIILDKPITGTLLQDYSAYKRILKELGGHYINGHGKVVLKLDMPLANDIMGSTPAEFVPLRGTGESKSSEMPF